jgi:hypothetical protein
MSSRVVALLYNTPKSEIQGIDSNGIFKTFLETSRQSS